MSLQLLFLKPSICLKHSNIHHEHLYLHVIRFPLSIMLGNIPIISGERELHSGQVKINQTAEALDFYLEVADYFNVKLLFPLRRIERSSEIEELLQMPWQMNEDQLECVFRGNYRLLDGSIDPSFKNVNYYFKEFGLPLTKKAIKKYLEGNSPDIYEIVRQIVARKTSDLH